MYQGGLLTVCANLTIRRASDDVQRLGVCMKGLKYHHQDYAGLQLPAHRWPSSLQGKIFSPRKLSFPFFFEASLEGGWDIDITLVLSSPAPAFQPFEQLFYLQYE